MPVFSNRNAKSSNITQKILDLSEQKRIPLAKHWNSKINQLYHPSGFFEQDLFSIIYSFGNLNTTKFTPILLKEWFCLVKPEGYLVIDYQPNEVCNWQLLEKTMWWLWKGKYEILFHGSIKKEEYENNNKLKLFNFIKHYRNYNNENLDKKSLLPKPVKTEKKPAGKEEYLRFVCIKKSPSKIPGDSINKWTFGIITNGKRLEWIEKIIESIKIQKIPHYEILICGSYFKRKEKEIKYFPFNQRDELGWITKKKNIILKNAKYENVCVIHDRLVFDKNWYKGMKKWGNFFEHLACVQEFEQKRANDWELHEKVSGQEFGWASLMDYKDWDVNCFQSGQLHIVKKSLAKNVLWNESYLWKQPEDLEISSELTRSGYMLRFNADSKVILFSYALGDIPKVIFDKIKLSKKREDNFIRRLQREFYILLSKSNFSRKTILFLWKKAYNIS